MALFHTTVVDNQIKALSTIGSVSGSIATFETDKAENLVNLEVAIVATQSGSGTPSPSNPRTISGFSACNLSVNGTTETISFGQTVYGGSLNVGSGVLTVTHGYVDLGTLSGWYYNSSQQFWQHEISGIKSGTTDAMCSDYQYVEKTWSSLANYEFGISGTNMRLHNDTVSTSADLQTQLSGALLVYELATPLTIQLDSKQIQTIIGTNNIYSDTGDIIDLKFVLSVGKAIS